MTEIEFRKYVLEKIRKITGFLTESDRLWERSAMIELGMLIATLDIDVQNFQEEDCECKSALHEESH